MKNLKTLSIIIVVALVAVFASVVLTGTPPMKSGFVAVVATHSGIDTSSVFEVTVWPDGTVQKKGLYAYNRATGQPVANLEETPAAMTEILDPVNRKVTLVDPKSNSFLESDMSYGAAIMRSRPKRSTCKEEFPSRGPCTPGPKILGFDTYLLAETGGGYKSEALVAPELGWFTLRRTVLNSDGTHSITEQATSVTKVSDPPKVASNARKFVDLADFTAATEKARGRNLAPKAYEYYKKKQADRELAMKAAPMGEKMKYYAGTAVNLAKRACSL